MKKLHFIAIGGAAMHNLAIALKNKGYKITGSDDEIFEPSRSRLEKYGLLPQTQGWDTKNITADLDGVILGMHARKDNPELKKASDLGLKIYSYPEYLYEQTKEKKRVVIAGSHGKTTITAMIIHVLTYCKVNFDFMVGSQIDGFETMVSLNDNSNIAVFEGDEYLSSPLDLRPKFIHYKPDIALISGISWDHINVFPTFESYVRQFEVLTEIINSNGHLVYFSGDPQIVSIVNKIKPGVTLHSYKEHKSKISEGETLLIDNNNNEIPLLVFGSHNLQNIGGVKTICNLLAISDTDFYKAIATFPGTAKRLQVLKRNKNSIAFIDFAHSPSKVRATVKSVKEQFPSRKVIAVFELHTFSSLNKEFIPQYAGTLDMANEAVVFFDSHVLEHKKMLPLSEDFVADCFGGGKVRVISDKERMQAYLNSLKMDNAVLLLMSSGNFAGIDIKDILGKIF